MLAVGVIALLVLLLICFKSPRSSNDGDYIERDEIERSSRHVLNDDICGRDLLTSTELEYFHFIESILPKGYRIFPQVSFNAFVHSNDISVRNKFNRKSCDMVLVRGDDFETIAVIEIDDPKSHNNKRARENDARRDEIVAQAGYPTLRFNNNDTTAYVRKHVLELVKKNPLY